jgi:hypothetical protein
MDRREGRQGLGDPTAQLQSRCAPKALEAGGPKPSICVQLAQWAAVQRKAIRDLLIALVARDGKRPEPWDGRAR